MVVNSPTGTYRRRRRSCVGRRGGCDREVDGVSLLDDEPVLLLVSGAHNVHLEHTGERLGGTLARADLRTAKHATGQPIGGIARWAIRRIWIRSLDQDLAAHPELWAAAGHIDTIFRSSYSQLLRITAGLAIDVT